MKNKYKKDPISRPETASDIVDCCQVELWNLQEELYGFSTLLCNLDPAITISARALNGTGLALDLASKRLEKIKDKLSDLILGDKN